MATLEQIRRRGRWSLIVGTLLAALTIGAVMAYADVTAVPYDANPGETVQITGDGMTPGENVRIEVNYPDGSNAQTHVVQADGSGNFSDTFDVTEGMPGGVYQVIATGEESGNVFTTTFDPNNIATTTTLSLSSSSITIGSSTTLSGTLAWTPGTYNQGQQTKDGRTIHLNRYTSAGCGGPGTLIADATTSGGGASGTASYSYVYTPATAGTQYVRASFDGLEFGSGSTKDTYRTSESACMQLDVNLIATSLTETLTPSTIFYGQQTGISGTSSGIPTSTSIGVTRGTAPNCANATTPVGSGTTDGSGNWGSLTYKPDGAGNEGIKAAYAGDATHASATDCQTLTVNKAPTAVVDVVLSDTLITPAESVMVDYKVQSAYGIDANNAQGTVSVVKDSGPGNLTCNATSTGFSVDAHDADGSGAADAGFGFAVNSGSNAAFRFTCTVDAGGSYALHVHNSGDSNYAAGDSSQVVLVVDSEPPTVTINFTSPNGGSPDGTNGWFKTGPVTGTVDADDTATGGSAITNISCTDTTDGTGGITLGALNASGSTGSRTISVSGDGTHNISCTAKDAADLTSDPATATVKIDTTPPSIVLTTPANGASYILNQSVNASYSCADTPMPPQSGLASCTGTVADGSAIDTASIGPKSFTVNATDNAGNTSSKTNNYTVRYAICLLYDPLKSHKAGSTVPIKLFLCDANGNDVSSSSIVVQATALTKVDNSASGVLDDSGAANSPENNFRYDGTLGPSGGYIFNLSSKYPSPALGQKNALTTGTWKLSFTIGGVANAAYNVMFDIK